MSEVLQIARDLIRFDTSNYDRDDDVVETPAAQYAMDLFAEVGLHPEWYEPIAGHPSVILRIPGEDRTRPGLLIHGHLDVVPAVAGDWSVDPFGAEIIDGMLYGRGAVDMKNMCAMIIALVRNMAREGWQPPRDIVVGLLADEETGGKRGAHQLVNNRPEWFAGVSHAISEVGGYNTYVNGRRVYLLQTAEKGISWYKITATGRAGHGSQINEDNAVTKLAQALAAIGNEPWPIHLSPTVRTLLTGVAELSGIPFADNDPEIINTLIDALGPAKRYVGATTKSSAQLTQIQGGYSTNVIPGQAWATVDARPLPGHEKAVEERLRELARGCHVESIHQDDGIEYEFSGPEVAAMVAALKAEDPQAEVLPYMLSAGTDNKAFSKLGIKGYGFAPVQVPPGFDFPAMFHGVDERIPVDSLDFGLRVLTHFVRNC
ncbi:MAG: M20/M25/M40 family metallo-hydrolase [Actinomycetaceae bacterium]|nr:M20/M25/M40 family metallo-hydrolase [Actinomycetaceae bacterium]